MGDSYLGDAGLIAELISGQLLSGDDGMGYLGDDEVGLRAKRAMRKLKSKGYNIERGGGGGGASSNLAQLAQSNPALAQAVAKQASQQAIQMQVAQSGMPATAGSFLAATGQRKEPVNLGTVTLAITVAATGSLSVTLQRALQTEKLVLQASDSTTGADMLFSVGITNAVIGSHNLFATPGTVGAATAFARDSWETNIMSVPLGQGGSIRVDLQKITATTNTTVCSGTVFGTGAQG